jgi:ATP-binding cassette subfamily F protein uup
LLLVSHDRDFLDNVVTSTFVMEEGGRIGEYVGGYSDWLRQRPQHGELANHPSRQSPSKAEATAVLSSNATAAAAAGGASSSTKRKLSYKDARELEQLPQRIEALEIQIAAATDAMHAPGFFAQAREAVAAHEQELSALQAELELAYARWETLESGG